MLSERNQSFYREKTIMAVTKHRLGRTTLDVPPLTFGGNVFGWTVDEKSAFNLLDALLAHGLNFIDTADVYSTWVSGNHGGESETVIGNWLKRSGKRNETVIATKVGKPMGDGKTGLSARYITQAVEDSLRRLQTDYIDLYQAHEDDLSTPLEETLKAFDDLVKAGKVRFIGASNYSAARFAQALEISEQHGFVRYDTLQPEYNLYDRAGYELELEPLAIKNDIAVINYYALASGFLSGKYRLASDASQSARGKNVVANYLNQRGLDILKALDRVAGRYEVSEAQVALAWLMARPSISAPIVSATSIEQIDELTQAMQLKLSKEDILLLDDASAYPD
jgi:aryl-alcohol dehydrogenase-like predicted oxidoreductase